MERHDQVSDSFINEEFRQLVRLDRDRIELRAPLEVEPHCTARSVASQAIEPPVAPVNVSERLPGSIQPE